MHTYASMPHNMDFGLHVLYLYQVYVEGSCFFRGSHQPRQPNCPATCKLPMPGASTHEAEGIGEKRGKMLQSVGRVVVVKEDVYDGWWCLMIVCGGWWLLMMDDDGWWWLMVVDDHHCWFMIVGDRWWWLMVGDGWWLMMDDDGWWCLMMVDDDWCWLIMVKEAFWGLMRLDDV